MATDGAIASLTLHYSVLPLQISPSFVRVMIAEAMVNLLVRRTLMAQRTQARASGRRVKPNVHISYGPERLASGRQMLLTLN